MLIISFFVSAEEESSLRDQTLSVSMAEAQPSIDVDDFTVDFKSFDEERFRSIYEEYGVCVVLNAFSDEFCDSKVNEIVSFFENLGTGITRDDANTFSEEKVPQETKPGMYHGLVGNLPAVWELRTADVVRKCFSVLYQYDGKFICSSDGFTLTPNRAYPKPKDWPQVNQTTEGMFRCVQGQAVLTNTTSAFVCSPKSHLLHGELITLYKSRNTNNILRLERNLEHAAKIEKRVAEIGGAWQIPVEVPRGSLIFWTSALIHSAWPSLVTEVPDETDPWKGWSCAVDICYRPVHQFTRDEIAKRAECVLTNRQTNNSAAKVMNKRSQGRSNETADKHPVIETLTENPIKVYQYTQRPCLDDPRIRELSGIDFCEHNSERIRNMMDIYCDKKLCIDKIIDRLNPFSENPHRKRTPKGK